MSVPKWEYKITQGQFHTPPLDITKPKSLDTIKHIEEMGEDGWEMINMIQQNMNFTFFWKREKHKTRQEWTI